MSNLFGMAIKIIKKDLWIFYLAEFNIFTNLFPAGAKLVLPPTGEIPPKLKPVNLNRPRLAPPPGPPNNGNSTPTKHSNYHNLIYFININFLDKSISNGQSSESLNSLNDGQNTSRVQANTPLRKVSVNI